MYDVNSRFDNLSAYRLADKWARDRLMMVQDLYNFSGTANVWNGRILWVDENTILVPKHCLDVNNLLVSTNLYIVSWPQLMPDNTDYSATTDNMVDDGNMEHSGITDWGSPGTPVVEAKATDVKRSGTQAYHIQSDAANEGLNQDLSNDGVGTDYYVGFDYSVIMGNVKLELLNDASAVIQTVTKGATCPDRIVNGGFGVDSNWTKGTGWTIAAGVASSDGTQIADADLDQDTAYLTVGKVYRVKFTVSGYVAGNVTAVVGSAEGTDRAANGTYIQDITCTVAGVARIRADLNFVGNVDDVEYREISNAWFEEYRTCYEVPTGSTGITVQAVSNAANDDFYIDKIIVHKSLVDNGGMEGTYSGGIAPGWTAEGTITGTKDITYYQSGTASQKIVADAANEGIISTATITTVVDTGYTVIAYVYVTSGAVAMVIDQTTDITRVLPTTIGAWEKHCLTFIADSTTTKIKIISSGAAATFYVDDVAMITLDSAAPSTNTVKSQADSFETSSY